MPIRSRQPQPQRQFQPRVSYAVPRQPYRATAPESRPSRLNRKSKALLLLFAIVVCASYGGWNRHVSAHALAIKQAQAAVLDARNRRIASLPNTLQQILGAHPEITASVSVEETYSSQSTSLVHVGTTSTFDAASTGKLISAAAYLHFVDQGTVSLTRQLDGVTAEDWLQKMIVNSDDTAWQEINDYLTHPVLARYADQLGIRDYNVDDNELGSDDIALVLQKLSQGTLLSPARSELLLSYLKQANYRSYIVPAIAASDTVYHKVGVDDDTVNDSAIITRGSQKLVLVIFTDGNQTYNWSLRASIMQQITRQVTSAYFL